MRIPSSVYKAPGTFDGQGPDGVSRGIDGKKIEGRDSDSSAKRDAVETRVNVSRKAHELATENAVDLAKIERLRLALHRGDFKVDARAIAARIVNGD